jgi:periplasmic protein TonB
MPSQVALSLEPPLRPTRRRSDHSEGKVSRDRLVTMCVLTALLHGLLILGITFTAPPAQKSASDPSIEVLLVSDELPEERENVDAVYLSQRTQSGSGNSTERRAAEVPTPGRPGEEALPSERNDAESLEEQLLASAGTGARARITALPLPATLEDLAADARPAEAASEETLRLRGETRDELYVTADTRASELAPYLDAWRRRVERIGTINYPSAAQRQGLSGNPVIEVVLQRDGKLQSARIINSSGHPEIDAAALDILRLASPFDPFPQPLAREYRVLRFAYEWQFAGGRLQETAISVP